MPKILGIDYGEKRIGLAIADATLKIAHPHSVIASGEKAADEIARLIRDEGIITAVLGLPRSLSGEEGPQAAIVRRFGEAVAKAAGIEIVFQDERFSSKIAEDILIKMDKSRSRRRDIADAHQAAVILQTYLDSLGDG
jgi:putative Holliday junction resolvase